MSLMDVQVASGGRFNPVVIGSYERATRRPRLDTLYELADFYDIPVQQFLLPKAGRDGSHMIPAADVVSGLDALRDLFATTVKMSAAS